MLTDAGKEYLKLKREVGKLNLINIQPTFKKQSKTTTLKHFLAMVCLGLIILIISSLMVGLVGLIVMVIKSLLT